MSTAPTTRQRFWKEQTHPLPSLLPHRDYELGEHESSPYRTETFKSEKHWCYLSFAHKSLLHVKWGEKTKKQTKTTFQTLSKNPLRFHLWAFETEKENHILHFLVYAFKKDKKAKNQTKELDGYNQFHAFLKRTSKTT